jgi:hypothetical protein
VVSGKYMQTVTTHWMGDWPTPWAVTDMIGPELADMLQFQPQGRETSVRNRLDLQRRIQNRFPSERFP